MRILFTGASSFTGFWFVKRLSASGHELVCPLRGDLGGTGMRARRVELLQPLCRLLPHAPFGSDNFLRIASEGTYDLLCHHAAEVADYKSPDFDPVAALAKNSHGLRRILADLKTRGLRGLILTGTYFEPDEGRGSEPLRAFSPYGLSKALTWQVFRYYCAEAALPLGKFVLPNPFGPLEEFRFTGHLMRQWRAGQCATVKTPDYVRDNIHVDLLACAYAQFALQVARGTKGMLRINPSGYAESQGQFAQRLASEVRQRTGWDCALELMPQQEHMEPLIRVNMDPVAARTVGWNEQAAWDAFVQYHLEGTGGFAPRACPAQPDGPARPG